MQKQFIGEKQVAGVSDSGEKTAAGNEIVKVVYADGTAEHLSRTMFEKVASGQKCDATHLREKRIVPVVEIVLGIMREWGIKVGELPYFSALLNKSLDYNSSQALLHLLGSYMPKPGSLDDVDLITVDRILKGSGK